MKLCRFLLMMVCLIPGLVLAESSKIAVLDVDGAIRASKEFKQLYTEFQQQFSSEQERLKGLAAEGNALKAKIRKESDFLSETERKSLLLEVQNKAKEFQQLKNGLQQKFVQREREILKQLLPKADKIVLGLIKKYDIDIIVNKRALVYAKPSLQLTEEVIQELNKQ